MFKYVLRHFNSYRAGLPAQPHMAASFVSMLCDPVGKVFWIRNDLFRLQILPFKKSCMNELFLT
jgi:hypothetical protein